jgi:hypothetical protein
MIGIFGILESSATHCYRDVAPTQEFFFFIVTSIVYGCNACLKPLPFEKLGGPEFENRPIDGYVLSLTPGATVKSIRQVNVEKFCYQ